MKKNLLFILLLFFQCSFGQLTAKAVALVDSNKNGHLVVFHCSAPSPCSKEVLIVVDGVQVAGEGLADLNPNDILSITILKDPVAQALYGIRGMNGVILITTKRTTEFVVKDSIDGHAISSATVSFMSHEKNLLTLIASDSGRVVTGIKGWDQIVISATGYKNDTIKHFTVLNKKEILLHRDYKSCSEITVTGYGIRTIRCHGCSCRIIRTATVYDRENKQTSKLKAYPNPIARGQKFNIEFNNEQAGSFIVRLIAVDGKMVFQNELIVEKGLTHLTISADSKWAAGSYFIQLISNEEKLILQKQIVIQ